METLIFWVLAVLTVAAGVWVFRFDSMARATLALLVSFLTGGGLLILLGLGYLGVVVILMMVMEMMIMVIFMVALMMNPAGLMPMTMVHNARGSAALALVTFAGLAVVVFTVPWPERGGARPTDPTFQLGEALMGEAMLPMITLGFTLFATMVVTVVLATHRGRYDRYGDRLRGPASDPVRGGLGG